MALDLAKRLKRQGDEVVILAAGVNGALRGEVGDVPVVGIDAGLGVQSLARFVREVQRNIRTDNPDIILVHLLPLNLLMMALVRVGALRTPAVLVEHNHRSMAFEIARRPVRSRLTRLAMRVLYPRAKAIVGVSDRVAVDVARLAPAAGRIVAIPNGVDVDRIKAASESTTPESDWFESLSRPRLVAAGRLVEQKGFSDLVRSFAGTSAAATGNLVIVGEGPLRQELASLAEELGVGTAVHLIGFTGNPWAVMARSDLFVLSSVVEGFALVVAEAVACGVPVVSTDCLSGPADILDGNSRSRLVPVGDVPALAEAIDEMVAQGTSLPPARLAEQYTLEMMAEAYRELFVSLVESE